MRKWILAALAAALVVGMAPAAMANGQEKVTICHAAGLDGTTQYVTLELAWPAVYGEAGHFYENGTPRAGHEDDYLGPCEVDPEPELVEYRVVAGMPRYRGDVFLAEPGLTCRLAVDMAAREWTAYCGDHVDSGRINARFRTYVRLRQVGVPGPAQVLLDLR